MRWKREATMLHRQCAVKRRTWWSYDCAKVVLPLPGTSAGAACEVSLQTSETAARSWRRAAGEMSCAIRRRGPTGGFCLSKQRLRIGGNSCLPLGMAALLTRHFSNKSVLDLGCGVGQYGHSFSANPSIRWHGVDGAERVEEVTGGHVEFAELTDGVPRHLRALKWDWVISIEVAEHVPREGEAAFMRSVMMPQPTEGVLLSWAGLGQSDGGTGARHVNCQSRRCAHVEPDRCVG